MGKFLKLFFTLNCTFHFFHSKYYVIKIQKKYGKMLKVPDRQISVGDKKESNLIKEIYTKV